MLGRHVFQQCSELRVGSGAWAGRAQPDGGAWESLRKRDRRAGPGGERAPGAGGPAAVKEQRPRWTQECRGGCSGGGATGNAGPEWWGRGVGLGRAGAGDTAGCKQSGAQELWAGGAVCLRRKEGRPQGTCLGVSRVLRAVSCYSCCIIELLASLHKVTIILPALILTTSSLRLWSTQIREVILVRTLPSGCF